MAVSNIWDPILDPAFAGRALFDKPSDADGYLVLLDQLPAELARTHAVAAGAKDWPASSPRREPDGFASRRGSW